MHVMRNKKSNTSNMVPSYPGLVTSKLPWTAIWIFEKRNRSGKTIKDIEEEREGTSNKRKSQVSNPLMLKSAIDKLTPKDLDSLDSFEEVTLSIPNDSSANTFDNPEIKSKDLEEDADDKENDLALVASISNKKEIDFSMKLESIRYTVKSLEESLKISRSLEAEQYLRYSMVKSRNTSLLADLRKAHKRNKNMLNLFRQNVTNVEFGFLGSNGLPETLKRDVQRVWHQKYDTLLKQNDQLKKEAIATKFIVEDKNKQIEALQQRLLNLAENLVEKEETVKNICTKYLTLKKRKDEQEILMRGSIESLQDALQKAKNEMKTRKVEISSIPSKDALLTREIRRSDRLAYENSLLRTLLQEARRECKNGKNSSSVSF